jgi:hypothetical protein
VSGVRSAGASGAVSWCAGVLGLVALVMATEVVAPSTVHPMTPGWWVPPVVLLLAGVIRAGYSAVVGRRVGVPGWLSPACLVLPAEQRTDWLMLVAAVLHAEGDRAGRRRQVIGFLAALPATVLLGWWLWLHSHRRPRRGSGS